jgi:hypothetical protein
VISGTTDRPDMAFLFQRIKSQGWSALSILQNNTAPKCLPETGVLAA